MPEIFAVSANTKNLSLATATSCLSANYNNDVFYSQPNSSEVAKLLGWTKDLYRPTFCNGHYVDPVNIANTPKPKAMQDLPMNITASKHALFTQHGASTIKGDVTLVQPGREIRADCVAFFRDTKTGKIGNSVLVGHVNFHEYGKLLVAQQSNLDFVNETYTLNNGFYRLLANTPSGTTNVWGRVKHAVRNAAGVLKMQEATYSACPPDATSWYLRCNKLTLDPNINRGESFNTVIFFKNAPIFYTPYLSFPLSHQRKSGFLYPDFMHSKDSGYGLFLPYYFNLAPNYDATFTPALFTKRGMLLEGLFNYLFQHNSGVVDVNYIPHDRAFTKFRNTAASFYPGGPALTRLQNSSSDRGFFRLQNNLSLNEHWRGSLNINYTTDDYFLRDFSSATTAINRDQLFNQAEINYADDHYRFLTSFQGFQTLHRVARDGIDNVKDQYKRLPQISLVADFPDSLGGLNYKFDSEVVNFTHRDGFYTMKPVVAGGRFNVGSDVSLPLNWLGVYLIPKIQLQATEYSVHHQENNSDPNNMLRVLPLVSVDGGATFSRNIDLFQHDYTQTLEPRLFYLFVPTKNQNNIPIFDTNLPAFDFNQLFHTNRFAGIDRIGDANQIVATITTRLFDFYGQEKLNASFGQIFAFHKHQVFLPSDISNIPDPLTDKVLSPLIGQLQYFITSMVNAKANAAWDFNERRFNTANINVQYNDNAERVINFWYNYSFHGDFSLEKQNANLSRIGVSLGWRLWQHWNVLGSIDYNISYHRAQNYIYGLEYDSCCWALRIVRGRTFIGVNSNKGKYDSRIYFQFFLKGLGDIGLGGLKNNLPISNYNDKRVIGL